MTPRCPCGNEPHMFPAHLQAQREQLRIRAVEMGKRRPEEPLPVWCDECILERLAEFLADDDIDGAELEAETVRCDVDRWIDGIQERMAKEERRR